MWERRPTAKKRKILVPRKISAWTLFPMLLICEVIIFLYHHQCIFSSTLANEVVLLYRYRFVIYRIIRNPVCHLVVITPYKSFQKDQTSITSNLSELRPGAVSRSVQASGLTGLQDLSHSPCHQVAVRRVYVQNSTPNMPEKST